MGHGFGTPRAVALYVYADAFARAGYGVVVFGYKHFGESERGHFDPPYVEPLSSCIIREQMDFLEQWVGSG